MNLNKISLQQGGQNQMIPNQPGMSNETKVDPMVQELSTAFAASVQAGQKPEEVVMSFMEQNVDQEVIVQALVVAGYDQNSLAVLFENIKKMSEPGPADAEQVNSNPQELARNEELEEESGGIPMLEEVETMDAKSGIEIKPENRGKFTKWAKARGMTVKQAYTKVLKNKDRYPASIVKMANFARNAAGWKKQEGGSKDDEEVTILHSNANQYAQELNRLQKQKEQQKVLFRNMLDLYRNDMQKFEEEREKQNNAQELEMLKKEQAIDSMPKGDPFPVFDLNNFIPQANEGLDLAKAFANESNLSISDSDGNILFGNNQRPNRGVVYNKPFYVNPMAFMKGGKEGNIGNLINAFASTASNLFNKEDGAFSNIEERVMQNELDKYTNANYNLNLNTSPENIQAIQKYVNSIKDEDMNMEDIANQIENIPVRTGNDRFNEWYKENKDKIGEIGKRTFDQLTKFLGQSKNGGDLPKAQFSFPDFSQLNFDELAQNMMTGQQTNLMDDIKDIDVDAIRNRVVEESGQPDPIAKQDPTPEELLEEIDFGTVDVDTGGILGALDRLDNSVGMDIYRKGSKGIFDIVSALNPFARDRAREDAMIDLRNQFNADNLNVTYTADNRGNFALNDFIQGSEADRVTGLDLLGKEGGEQLPAGVNNAGFRALPPSAQKNILDNMQKKEYGGPKGEEAYLARRDAAIKAAMDKAPDGKEILLSSIPSYVFADKFLKKFYNVSEDSAEDLVDIYDKIKGGIDYDEGLDLFNSIDGKDVRRYLNEAGISKKEFRNYIKNQDFYKDMNMFGKGAVNTALYMKGLKKGGEQIVNVDSDMLAKLIAAGADIEML